MLYDLAIFAMPVAIAALGIRLIVRGARHKTNDDYWLQYAKRRGPRR